VNGNRAAAHEVDGAAASRCMVWWTCAIQQPERCAGDQYRPSTATEAIKAGFQQRQIGTEPADCALGKFADHPQFLAQSEERRELSTGRR